MVVEKGIKRNQNYLKALKPLLGGKQKLKYLILNITVIIFISLSQTAFGGKILNAAPLLESPEQVKKFDLEVQRFILENPEIIIEAIKMYQQKKEQENLELELQLLKSKSKELFEDDYSFVGGNKNGEIRLVEFIDYKCSYCKENHKIIWNILKGNPDVKFIVKEFPILGQQSVLAAKALLAILLNDNNAIYKNFSDMLIKYPGPVNETILRTFAKRAGSSIENLGSAMDTEQVNVILDKNAALAKSLGIQGTPSFVIEDQIIRGFISENDFQKLVELVRENL